MTAPHGWVHPCPDTPVAIAKKGSQFQVVATQPVALGEKILDIYGRRTAVPTMYSVQIGRDVHIDLHDDAMLEAYPERYIWRFLNHRCQPNAVMRGTELFALEPIQPGDEVTFNYNANEYEMATPFRCLCPTHHGKTGVLIRGYKYLSETERFALRNTASPHVLEAARVFETKSDGLLRDSYD